MLKQTLATTSAVVLFALSNVAAVQAHESRSYGKVSALAGGVGVNARARLSDEAAADHNVKMVFSLNSGNYVADVHVKVVDKSGRAVIEGVAKGPWLYAQLGAGTYTVSATYRGETVTETVTVGRSGQRLAHFRWPASVEAQAAASEVAPTLGTGPQEPQR